MEPLNWHALREEAVQHLRALVRIDTTNPPGNETRAAQYLAEALREAGIDSVILEYAPGRGNLVARLKGRGEAPPLLLMGHTDVVPAEPEHWTHPPFSGEIADGFLWGRGALDMKYVVIMELMTLLLLKRKGANLARDVIFAATADEEVTGQGIRFLVREHPDLIRAEYALNEGGGYTQWIAGKPVYPVQVGEKGVCWTRARISGTPSHASVPSQNNAVVKLARALAEMRPMPQHVTPTVRTYVEGIAQTVDGALAGQPELLLDAQRGPELARRHFEPSTVNLLHALTHNTAVPTGLRAGYKTNVIPSTAEATLDGRFLPGFDKESFLAELRAAFPAELADDIELEVTEYSPALEPVFDSPLYRLAKARIEAMHPGAVAVPFIAAGATDAKYLKPLGVQVYGFAPLRYEKDDPREGLVHGHNERIPIQGFAAGLRTFYETVEAFVTSA